LKKKITKNNKIMKKTIKKSSYNAQEVLGLISLILAFTSLGYFAPFAVAVSKENEKATSIYFVNWLLGWTVIGWIVAMVMAVNKK